MADALIGMVSLQHKDSQQSRHDVSEKKVLQKTGSRSLLEVGEITFTQLFQPPTGSVRGIEKQKEHARFVSVSVFET